MNLYNLKITLLSLGNIPFANHPISVATYKSNAPVRLYREDGALLSPSGQYTLDAFGSLDVYVGRKDLYSITVYHPDNRRVEGVIDGVATLEARTPLVGGGGSGDGALLLTGGSMSGPLLLKGDATQTKEAVPLQQLNAVVQASSAALSSSITNAQNTANDALSNAATAQTTANSAQTTANSAAGQIAALQPTRGPEFTYGVDGLLSSVIYDDGRTKSFEYNPQQQLTRVTFNDLPPVVRVKDFTYNTQSGALVSVLESVI